jgi:sugar phosphate isomerase/epimerase
MSQCAATRGETPVIRLNGYFQSSKDMNTLPIAIQLYTVRDLCAMDFAGTVRHVADIGYQAVEMAGYGNVKTAGEARKALDDAGLKVAGIHAPIEKCEANLNEVLDDCDVLGTKVVIIPWMPEPRRETASAWRTAAASLSKIAAAANRRGFELAYHNHSFEFDRFDGQSGMEILFNTAAPALKAELDVYWIRHGGGDPVELINRFGKRTVALHLKDMAAGDDRRFAPVGTGLLDFVAICAAAVNAGVLYGAVEQDDCYGAQPLEVIRVSFENLKKLGIA